MYPQNFNFTVLDVGITYNCGIRDRDMHSGGSYDYTLVLIKHHNYTLTYLQKYSKFTNLVTVCRFHFDHVKWKYISYIFFYLAHYIPLPGKMG